ncbi:ABC transporter substrate-binding protein [Halioglobus maricola]|uniref:ABC transporter substrate-binding protein n=1 Tax=Halioglobus maricola TaxID=2601894 RepID=A0A5P9NHE6_9GAMM|nr:ABC transporter substrate-binding protein [Halioglobus maricola]QFU74955.1 ABC transporter substrate-binding protein [Halioglobus maricola]
MRFGSQLTSLVVLFLFALAVRAEGQDGAGAHDVVRSTSERIMVVVAEAQEYADEDSERYYAQVQEILDPVIDFRGFARGVMGPYASSERYRSLDEPGRAQLRGQLDRFTEVMRIGLVRTYSKGLLAFGGSRIEVSSPAPDEAQQSKVAVEQLIYTEDSKPYIVIYQMGRDKSGDWKLRNVIIENVNLGEIYRNQFEAAARKQDGNLDAVIESWSAIEVKDDGES